MFFYENPLMWNDIYDKIKVYWIKYGLFTIYNYENFK